MLHWCRCSVFRTVANCFFMIPWQYTWLLFDDRWTAGMKTLISYVTVFTSSYRHWKASTSYCRSCQQTLYLWICWRSLCCELCCQWENFFCTWTLVSLYTGCFFPFLMLFGHLCTCIILFSCKGSQHRYSCLSGSLPLLLFLNTCAILYVLLRRLNTVSQSVFYVIVSHVVGPFTGHIYNDEAIAAPCYWPPEYNTMGAHGQRRNATIRGPRHFLRSGPLPSDLK